MKSFARIALICFALTHFHISGQNAYIANQLNGTVSVISLASPYQIAPTIPVGTSPFGVAVSPDGAHVYVTNAISGNVSVIATASNSVIATVPVGTRPQGVAVTPDSAKVYVANSVDGTVSAIDTSSNKVTATIPVAGGPFGLAASLDGTKIYATNTVSGNVSVISVGNNTVTASIPVGQRSGGLAVSPDGTALYVASSIGSNGAIFVISTATDTVATTFQVGFRPTALAVTPDGAKLYVVDADDIVWVIATTTNAFTKELEGLIVPSSIAVTPDGSQAYVVCSQSVFIIDTATDTVQDQGIPGLFYPSAFGNFIQPAPAQSPILSGGVVNAASYATTDGAGAPVAPGSLVAIFTTALSASAASFSTATLPPSLGGVSVTFKGIPAPMVQVAPTGAYPFVSAQVPFGVLAAGESSATIPVVISVNNVPSAASLVQIVASQPGIFTLNAQGTGQAVFVNLADYSIAAPSGTTPGSHPIPRGQSAFFYVTGLGAMTPAVADGSGTCPAPDGLCDANAMPSVTVGGFPAEVVFAGQAPGFPGVEQINLSIPQNVSSGSSVPVIVRSADGMVISNSATIAVQ